MFLHTVLREHMTALTNSMQARENASAKLDMAPVTGTTACSHSFCCRLYLNQYCLIHTVLSYCLQASHWLSFSKYTNTVLAEINFISKILDSDIQIK